MFEAYSVAVKLSLIDRVSTGLMGLSRNFAKVHGNAKALQTQLDKIKLTMMGGAVLAGAGFAGLALIGKTVPAAKEYVHQLQQMNIAGMKQVEIAKATAAAWNAAKSVPTSNASENLAAIRELRMVFGDTNHAIENMPTVQRLQAVLANTKGVSNAHDEAYTVAKALEMKGAVRTPGEFTTQADMMAKAIVASGGKVGANDFLSTFKYGRSATQGWNDTFAYSILPTLMQEMKSSGGSGGSGGPGNALMSAYAAVVGGTVPKKALAVWDKLGLLDKSKIVNTTTGDTKGLRPGGIMGGDLFQASPYEWTQKILLPALAKAGYKTPAEQRQVLQYLFPNRTAGFVMGQMALQPWKFERDQKLIRGASGLAAYNTLLKNDPEMQALAVHKQWRNLMISLGVAVMPMLIAGARVLIPLLQSMSKWFIEHPKLTKALIISFVALSGAMAISGTILLLVGAFSALAVVVGGGAGLAIGVGSTIVALTALGFSALATGNLLHLGGRQAENFGRKLRGMIGSWVKANVDLGGAWNAIKNGVSAFVSFIIGKAKALLSAVPNAVAKTAKDHAGALAGAQAGFAVGGIPGAIAGAAIGAHSDKPGVHGSSYVRPSSGGSTNMTGDVHMDGRKVGKVVWQHQANEQNRPPAGGGGYDPSYGLTPVGMSAA